MTPQCIHCMCQAATGCNITKTCADSGHCGAFHISLSYWIDGGKLKPPSVYYDSDISGEF